MRRAWFEELSAVVASPRSCLQLAWNCVAVMDDDSSINSTFYSAVRFNPFVVHLYVLQGERRA